jgi:hypothetical protein
VGCLVAFPVHAICWVKSVDYAEGGAVKVRLDSGIVAGITRRGGAKESLWGKGRQTFSLREGDRAHLAGGTHDTCTVDGVIRDGRLGVELNATSCGLHGQPCTKERVHLRVQ